MRSPTLVKYINSLTSKDFSTITLDRPGPYNKPQVHQDTAVPLSDYPGTVRQLIVTGLGHHQPTVIITNHSQASHKALISHYARRMTIEQRLAEIIRAFCTDALSSTVNLNVDLDVMLAVLAQALLAALRARLPGYHAVTPDTLQRRDAPTHPSCAKPASPPRPPSPGGATASCATSSPEPRAEPVAWKSALAPPPVTPRTTSKICSPSDLNHQSISPSPERL